MSEHSALAPDGEPGDGTGGSVANSAFAFTGTWKEFLPIALTNLLLTVVTLGIYRFWATARTRRYLWSRTRFADDTLEWTGTGLEMFIGFLLIIVFLIPFILFYQFGIQALLLRGEWLLTTLGFAAFYAGFLYLIGLATFRALRYRLSRTYWHGIRGGSDDAGWKYGWSAFWKTVSGALIFGLLIPWSMAELWNDRWNRMSFGPHRFAAAATHKGLMGRWLLIYVALVGPAFLLGFLATTGVFGAFDPNAPGSFVPVLLAPLVVYLGLLVASVAYYAKFFRQAIGMTKLGPVDFQFNASSKDWFKLIGGTILLVVVTLGIGLIFVSYRNWSFFVRHLESTGDVNLDEMTQSTARGASDAEGLAAAFDIGAI